MHAGVWNALKSTIFQVCSEVACMACRHVMFSCAHMSLCPVPAGGHGARTRGCSWRTSCTTGRMGGTASGGWQTGGTPPPPPNRGGRTGQRAAAPVCTTRIRWRRPWERCACRCRVHKRVMRGLFQVLYGTRHTVFQAWSQLGRLVSCSLIRAAKGYHVCKRTIYAPMHGSLLSFATPTAPYLWGK